MSDATGTGAAEVREEDEEDEKLRECREWEKAVRQRDERRMLEMQWLHLPISCIIFLGGQSSSSSLDWVR